MARAWEQAGAAASANAVLRGSQLARELGSVVMERHLAPLPAPQLVAITQPAHAQIQLAATVDAALEASRVPEAAVSGAMRRLASPQGVIARRAAADPAGRTCSPPPTGVVTPAGRAPGRHGRGGVRAGPAGRRRHAAGAVGRRAARPAARQPRAGDGRCSTRAMARVAAPADTWTRPDPLAPVDVRPALPRPDVRRACSASRRRCSCPASSDVEADGVALLETTPRVIEAYMAGLNHELSRELLWREFPAALDRHRVPPVLGRQRPARRPRDARRRPAARAVERRRRSGSHLRGGSGQLVLLVRGELLRRYPTTTIYAAKARPPPARSTRRRGSRRCSAPRSRPTSCSSASRSARTRALDRPRLVLRLRAVPGRAALRLRRGRRRPACPKTPGRAGLGARRRSRAPATPTSPSRSTPPAPTCRRSWGKNAANTASLTFQQPFRVAMHASRLIVRSALMTDLAAIAAARAKGMAAEADALVLADQLVAAKADRARRARRPRAAARAASPTLQQAVAEAQARVAAATQALSAVNAQASAAQAAADAADSAADAAAVAVGRPRSRGAAGADRRRRRAAGRDRRGAAAPSSTRSSARARGAQPGAARPSAAAARAHRAAGRRQRRAAGRPGRARRRAAGRWPRRAAAGRHAGARRPRSRRCPGTLSASITAQRTKVTTAWQPWDALLSSAHAGDRGAPHAADLERLRAELVAGENPDDLARADRRRPPARAAARTPGDALRRGHRPARARLPGQRCTSTRTSPS